jgi:uncharacterized phiE125 gp8 family phage protein
MINIVLDTAPTEEPVSLAEAKLHLRIDVAPTSPPAQTPEDNLILTLVKVARRHCEHFQNRAYIDQVWRMYLPDFPAETFIEIPKPPLQNVLLLEYKDTAGLLQTVSFTDPSGGTLLETDDYIVDTASEPGRLCLKSGAAWPSANGDAMAVCITFAAGYGLAEDVPEEIKQAMLLTLTRLYEGRGEGDEALPGAAKALLWPERIMPV